MIKVFTVFILFWNFGLFEENRIETSIKIHEDFVFRWSEYD